jgi:hypothetical protein
VLGSVKIHARTIFSPNPQWTLDIPRVAPSPNMDPVIVCVVDVGTWDGMAANTFGFCFFKASRNLAAIFAENRPKIQLSGAVSQVGQLQVLDHAVSQL